MSQSSTKTEPKPRAAFSALYRYATKSELLSITFSVGLAALAGIALPLFVFVTKDVYESMADAHEDSVSDAWIRNKVARGYSKSEVKELIAEHDNADNTYYWEVLETAQLMLVLGAFSFISCFVGLVLFVRTGVAQANYFREAYLEGLLKKPISYYEHNKPGSVCTSIDTECTKIELATGEKLFILIYSIFFVSFGLGFALFCHIQLALLNVIQTPIFIVGGLFVLKAVTKQAELRNESLKKSGGFVEECLIELPLIKSLCAQEAITQKFREILEQPANKLNLCGFMLGLGYGIAMSSIYINSAFICYIAGVFLDDHVENWSNGEEIKEEEIVMIITIMIITNATIGNISACVQGIVEGRVSAHTILTELQGEQEPQEGSTPQLDRCAGCLA
mmetsp:Transcript_6835/g.12370  ORF Transcript_6835/g.12370 Transcript_6835/m.12370 type:complete len:392 (+) Transcript_6835:81-1256(+)